MHLHTGSRRSRRIETFDSLFDRREVLRKVSHRKCFELIIGRDACTLKPTAELTQNTCDTGRLTVLNVKNLTLELSFCDEVVFWLFRRRVRLLCKYRRYDD